MLTVFWKGMNGAGKKTEAIIPIAFSLLGIRGDCGKKSPQRQLEISHKKTGFLIYCLSELWLVTPAC